MAVEGVRGVLTQASSAEEAWRLSHVRYQPSPDIAGFVEHYWSVSWDLRGVRPQRVETLPHPSIHMVFDRTGGGCIAGVTRGKFVRMLEEEGGVFGVKFKPGGFHPFLQTPVSGLTDRSVALRDVFGPEGDELDAAVRAECDDAGRVRVVDAFLRGRETTLDANVVRIAEIVYSVARERGILKVEDLVARYGLSARTLQRLFAKYVGVTPKWVIQRYRLHEAAAQLATGEPVSHAMLAASLGYSDQAHFVKDFKATVGASPGAYAATRFANDNRR